MNQKWPSLPRNPTNNYHFFVPKLTHKVPTKCTCLDCWSNQQNQSKTRSTVLQSSGRKSSETGPNNEKSKYAQKLTVPTLTVPSPLRTLDSCDFWLFLYKTFTDWTHIIPQPRFGWRSIPLSHAGNECCRGQSNRQIWGDLACRQDVTVMEVERNCFT